MTASVLYYSRKLEVTKLSINNRKMYKPVMAQSYNGIILSKEKEETTDRYINNVNDPLKDSAVKEARSLNYILCVQSQSKLI